MKISRLSVRNYRSLAALDLELADYTALVGANGAGKSSALYALDWFFRGYDLDESDIAQSVDFREPEIRVEVTFDDLSPTDRGVLGQFGRGQVARLARSWRLGRKGTTVTGNAFQGPGFASIRAAEGVQAVRAAYRALEHAGMGLPGLAGNVPRADVLAALDEWERLPEHFADLIEVEDVDASFLFTSTDATTLSDLIRVLLVPAATDMPGELGSSGKGSALAELIGAIVADAGIRAQQLWLEENAAAVESLNRMVLDNVGTSVFAQQERINANLRGMVPDARVSFVPTVAEWKPQAHASVATSVTIDKATTDVSRQGHGIQRAVMIALLQSLVPEVVPVTGSDAETADPPETGGPALLVCIEEPEIYQHPIRARSFGRVLAGLASRAGAQVMVATHSPYFVTPQQFTAIRRFRVEAGKTVVSEASIDSVETLSGASQSSIQKFVEKQLPTTFAEGFFADSVVLVEGDTDRVVIETLAIRLGIPFDERGISVIALGGKSALKIPAGLLESLGIPTFVVADGDADGASRNHSDEGQARRSADASNRSATQRLVEWLPESVPIHGTIPYTYGDPSLVTGRYVIWRDDLESELANWPSFLDALIAAGGKLRDKSVLTYRTAITEARTDDLPAVLRGAIEAIVPSTAVTQGKYA